jgi:acyl-CoA thioesterase
VPVPRQWRDAIPARLIDHRPDLLSQGCVMPRSSLNTANSEAAARLAEQTAAAMFSRDAASRLIGITIVSIRPGYSLLTMKVRPDMVNGHHICHGGYLFTLADSAFAYACNAYNRNTVASACHIDFLTPAREGELLEAECEERSRSGRTGVYDTTIRGSPWQGHRPLPRQVVSHRRRGHCRA